MKIKELKMFQKICKLRSDIHNASNIFDNIMWRKIYCNYFNKIVKIRENVNFPLYFSRISNLESLINDNNSNV